MHENMGVVSNAFPMDEIDCIGLGGHISTSPLDTAGAWDRATFVPLATCFGANEGDSLNELVRQSDQAYLRAKRDRRGCQWKAPQLGQ